MEPIPPLPPPPPLPLEPVVNSDHMSCICQGQIRDDQDMIQCDSCLNWFHHTCVQVNKHQVEAIDRYICPICRGQDVAFKKDLERRLRKLKVPKEDHYSPLDPPQPDTPVPQTVDPTPSPPISVPPPQTPVSARTQEDERPPYTPEELMRRRLAAREGRRLTFKIYDKDVSLNIPEKALAELDSAYRGDGSGGFDPETPSSQIYSGFGSSSRLKNRSKDRKVQLLGSAARSSVFSQERIREEAHKRRSELKKNKAPNSTLKKGHLHKFGHQSLIRSGYHDEGSYVHSPMKSKSQLLSSRRSSLKKHKGHHKLHRHYQDDMGNEFLDSPTHKHNTFVTSRQRLLQQNALNENYGGTPRIDASSLVWPSFVPPPTAQDRYVYPVPPVIQFQLFNDPFLLHKHSLGTTVPDCPIRYSVELDGISVRREKRVNTPEPAHQFTSGHRLEAPSFQNSPSRVSDTPLNTTPSQSLEHSQPPTPNTPPPAEDVWIIQQIYRCQNEACKKAFVPRALVDLGYVKPKGLRSRKRTTGEDDELSFSETDSDSNRVNNTIDGVQVSTIYSHRFCSEACALSIAWNRMKLPGTPDEKINKALSARSGHIQWLATHMQTTPRDSVEQIAEVFVSMAGDAPHGDHPS
ncbi:hypothetical protein BLNAU_116 [Blattamonas nauphoetae]|uniref:PHD-type domain-containing protein n=1 Tax=Blattamonas nauphoetae TaxID=2049346 RepID=A0ABQ9YM30_9EUKA|nr:hypothetical protein BLNAU_116 [Blattamonas nauphoetae]